MEKLKQEDEPAPKQPAGVARRLEAVLAERELQTRALPTKIVGYMDMLGFGALVRKHPGSFNIEISDDGSKVATSTSKSSERFGRFHAVLDRTAMNQYDASRPERMM